MIHAKPLLGSKTRNFRPAKGKNEARDRGGPGPESCFHSSGENPRTRYIQISKALLIISLVFDRATALAS